MGLGGGGDGAGDSVEADEPDWLSCGEEPSLTAFGDDPSCSAEAEALDSPDAPSWTASPPVGDGCCVPPHFAPLPIPRAMSTRASTAPTTGANGWPSP